MRSKRKRTAVLLSAVVVPLALLAACSSGTGKTTAASSSSVINIGMISPLTGPFAPLGAGNKEGAEIAVSQINQAGGIDGHKVNLIIDDDRTDPSQALVDFNALQGQGVAAILGSSLSDSASAVAPRAERAQIPYLSLSPVDQTVNPVEPYVFLVPAVTPTYTTRLMQWLKSEGITKIAVGYDKDNVYATNGYHSTLHAAPGYGVKVVDSETFETTTTDFSGTVTHVAASGAQAFLPWVTGAASVILTKTFAGANLGTKTRLVMTTSDATPLYAKPAGAAANGVVMSASPAVIGGDLPSSPLKTEIQKLSVPFAAKYGGQPSEFAADAYSGAEILFAALKKATPSFSNSDLQAALNHLSVLTPDGQVNFTSSSHSGLNPDDVVMVTVQNGVFQPTPWEKSQYGTLPK